MVLPELKPEMTRQEVIDAYKGVDWKKNLEFDWIHIESRTGEPHVKKLRFNADTIPCQRDSQHQLTFVQLSSTGVTWTCGVCGKTDGPISEELGQTVSDRQLSIQEAWDVLKKTGQYPPVGLKKTDGSRVRIKED